MRNMASGRVVDLVLKHGVGDDTWDASLRLKTMAQLVCRDTPGGGAHALEELLDLLQMHLLVRHHGLHHGRLVV